MTFKQAALKLLSCGLRTREDEDRVEVAEAIAWATWALMEQARYENVDDTTVDLNEEDCGGEIFKNGDRVVLISHGDEQNIYWEPEIGTSGVVQDVCNNTCDVLWPDRSTEAGRDDRGDCWNVDNYKLKKIP